jgi:hypothetical protein
MHRLPRRRYSLQVPNYGFKGQIEIGQKHEFPKTLQQLTNSQPLNIGILPLVKKNENHVAIEILNG